MARQRGFTLIELMIVVLVIAVLASIALSGYQKQVRKSRRTEARQVLGDLVLRQEKYRANNTTYGACNDITGLVPGTSTNCANYNANQKYYTVAVSANTATGYTMTATAKTADQLKDSCGVFTYQMIDGVLQKSAANTADSTCTP